MAINTIKDNLRVNQLIGKTRANVLAEDDIIIPDIKPDILSSIDTNGTVCVYKKDITPGKIKIEAGVQVYVVYLADDEKSNIRGINTTLNFNKVIEMDGIDENNQVDLSVNLKNIECKILNGRKINIKANVELDAEVFSNQDIEFIKEVQDEEDIQILNNQLEVSSVLGAGNTKVYAKDTINIESTDNLADVLNVNINIANRDIKTSYNKILAKSDVYVNIVYLTEDNRICEVNWKIPAMGFIDMPNISDENIFNVNYEIKNILVKPNGVDEHSIYVEIELEISCKAYEKKDMAIVQDLYSPSKNLKFSPNKISVLQCKQQYNDRCVIRDKIIPEDFHPNKICNVQVFPKLTQISESADRFLYNGSLELKIMYYSNITNMVDIKVCTKDFSGSIKKTDAQSGGVINGVANVENAEFKLLPDASLDANVDLTVLANVSKTAEISVIDKIDVQDNNEDNIYSIVVYFVKPGDTLWNIAKKFKSTIGAIASVNGIEDENKIDIGQQLFIPKFVQH